MDNMKSYIYCIGIGIFLTSCTTMELESYLDPIPGCTDSSACNYYQDANKDDDSCIYAEENYNCLGECVADIDCLGQCGGDAGDSDFCGVCNGDNFCNSLHMEGSVSGEGVCVGGEFGVDFGGSDIDECGVCMGDGLSCYGFGNRWVDFDELNNLVTFSINNQSTEYDDIIKYIGEPEFLEVLKNNEKNYILMWYKYKSKFYPITKTEHIVDKDNVYVSMDTIDIKPPLNGENEQWASNEDYLLIVFNNSDFEAFFVPFDNDRDPKFLKDYLFNNIDEK